MNIKLLVVGKTDVDFVQKGIEEYLKRLKHYISFEIDVIPALKDQKNASPSEVKEREGQLILKRLESADRVILLDEHGAEYSSVDFAQHLQKHLNASVRTLVFVIGGAFGFSPEVYSVAHEKISLSQMTFNHQMVRLFFVEQIYRAFTILRGEKYHNA